MSLGKIFVVATPIGNLDDITLRAIETLRNVDIILCEDTRVTKNLLNHFQIVKPLLSYHQHSDAKKYNEILNLLEQGKNLALVTDAGTPGISDPGGLLINFLVNNEKTIEVTPIPGACAAVTALSICGMSTDRFIFMGFPPHKNKRKKYFSEVVSAPCTVVFYESGHRIKKCLQELKALIPQRKIIVCRELTKKFETIYRGHAAAIADFMNDERGEFVIVIEKN